MGRGALSVKMSEADDSYLSVWGIYSIFTKSIDT